LVDFLQGIFFALTAENAKLNSVLSVDTILLLPWAKQIGLFFCFNNYTVKPRFILKMFDISCPIML